jgi:hypothetical protein
MNVEIGAEAALFPEKEYISGIFVAVCVNKHFPYIIGTVQYIFTRRLSVAKCIVPE